MSIGDSLSKLGVMVVMFLFFDYRYKLFGGRFRFISQLNAVKLVMIFVISNSLNASMCHGLGTQQNGPYFSLNVLLLIIRLT